MKLTQIGEFGLIDIIKNMSKTQNGIYGIGDDCAIIPIDRERELLVTTDTLVEEVHFLNDADAFYLGRKSLAVSISDIAAMAGVPKWAFLSLSLNIETEVEYVESFIKGFYACADEFNIQLLGGDTTKGSNFYITVMLIGENNKGESVKRSGAKAEDNIYVTGRIGCSYAGLTAIKKKLNDYDDLKMKHINPTPRIKEALNIKEYASAMIDISDGLVQDCEHICEQSKVAALLDFNKIPFCDTNLVSKKDMIAGGEDYELLFCADKKYENVFENVENITKIGIIQDGMGVSFKNFKDGEINVKGFKHF